MPTLVEKPPERDDWIHEVKFDGYRSQIVIDDAGVRIHTRRGLDWSSKYRDLVKAARDLSVESAIIDGEIIVLNEAACPILPPYERQLPPGNVASIPAGRYGSPQQYGEVIAFLAGERANYHHWLRDYPSRNRLPVLSARRGAIIFVGKGPSIQRSRP
ncbi:hypothetical protein [Mesorhizobium caraganae]|uniref:ATP-dependent DNA ligase n=1 Tax=Mesorhizobium caraganae TaxID=483206 RepID=UPI00333A2716